MHAPRPHRLRVLGRAFEPFARALRRQVAVFAPPTRLDDAWLELGELERRLLCDGALRDGTADLALVPTDWLAELIDEGHVAPLADGLPADWERNPPSRICPDIARTNAASRIPRTAAAGGRPADGLAPAFAGEAGADALRFLHDLWHVHRVVSPAARGWDSVESGRRFAAGEAALTVDWAGFAALSAPPGSPTHGLIACAPPPGRALNVYRVVVVAAVAMPRTPRLPALARVLSRLVAAAVDGPRDAIPSALATAREQAAEVLVPHLAAPTVHQGAPSR